jgi:hypothetical protein
LALTALLGAPWLLGALAAEERLEPDAHIRELQEALLREVDLLEARLSSLKGRIRRLCREMGAEAEAGAFDGRLGGGPPDPGDLAWRSVEDEEKYLRLRKKEETLLASWRKLGSRLARASEGEAAGEREKLQAERETTRSSLREVLHAELELRDRARRLEVERLRQDLAGIERALDSRSARDVRRKLVDSRLRELLREDDGSPVKGPPSDGPPPEGPPAK